MKDLFGNCVTETDLKRDKRQFNVNKTRSPIRLNRVIEDIKNPEFVLVVDDYGSYEQDILKSLAEELNYVPLVKIMYSTTHEVKAKDMVLKKLLPLIPRDWEIPERTKILAVGRSFHALMGSTDLFWNDFLDNKSDTGHIYLPKLKSYCWPFPNTVVAEKPWVKKWVVQQVKNLARHPYPNFRGIKVGVSPVVTDEDFHNLTEEAKNWDKVAIDIETSSLDFMDGRIGYISLCGDGKTGYLIPCDEVRKNHSITNIQGKIIKLFGLLKNKHCIYQNGKFDIKYLLRYFGIPRDYLRIDSDTMQLSHVVNEETSSSLKSLAWRYTSFGGYDQELDVYKEQTGVTNYLDIPFDIISEYAGLDAVATWVIENKLIKILEDLELKSSCPQTEDVWTPIRYYREVLIPAVNLFLDVEYYGLLIDIDRLREAKNSIIKDIDKAKLDIKKETGIINIDSPEQLGSWFEKQGWPCITRNTRGYATGENELSEWANMGYVLAEKIVHYRKLVKLYTTYIGDENDNSGIWQYIRKHDEDNTFRIHSNFAVGMADTGRNRSRDPNIQNFPTRGGNEDLSKHIKNFRSIFTCPAGYKMIEWDASGLQLRIGGGLALDETMIGAFEDPVLKGDLHSVTAQKIFCPDFPIEEFLKHKKEKPYSDYRQKAKSVNFGFLFGSSAISFAKSFLKREWSEQECLDYINSYGLIKNFQMANHKVDTGESFVTRDMLPFWIVAQDIRRKFFETYPGLETWIEGSVNFAIVNGYVTSPYGGIRRLPVLGLSGAKDKNEVVGEIKTYGNRAVNAPVQHSESGIMFTANLRILEECKSRGIDAWLVNSIHDSGMMIVKSDQVDALCDLIREVFDIKPPALPVLMEADIRVFDPNNGDYW